MSYMTEFTEMLKGFFSGNKQSYYLITDAVGYNTILRVDDLNVEHLNTSEFIYNHIGKVTAYTKSYDEVRFEVDGKQYALIGYDSGLVSI